MKKYLTIVVICLLISSILLLSVAMVVIADAGSQRWSLDSEISSADREMEKSTSMGNDGQSGSVTVLSGDSVIWLADEVAAHDNTFTDGIWIARLRMGRIYWWDRLQTKVRIGSWDPVTGMFTPFDNTTLSNISFFRNVYEVQIQTQSETIPAQDYLALEFENDSLWRDYTVRTDGRSYLRSPGTDPGYPLPELTTGILFGLGLLGLFGYSRWKSHKNRGFA